MSVVEPAAWFPDPSARYRLRYWDGQQWTAWVVDAGNPFLDTGEAIVVTRASVWYGMLRRMRVTIDGEIVGRISAGETRSFPVAPGRHRVRVGIDWISSRELEVVVPPAAPLRCPGTFRTFALTFVRPHRALKLETPDDPDRSSPVFVVAGLAAWFAFYFAITLLVTRF
jgi:hypothetical protein